MLAGAVFAILASSCGEQATNPKAVERLAPGVPTLSGGAPYRCTGIATCLGQEINSALVGETMKVCKVYPVGTVNPPAVTIQMTVITSNVTPIGMESGVTTSYTLQPNKCMWLWENGERYAADQVTITEIVPAGYTSTSQVTTIIRDGPKISGVEGPWKIVDLPTVQNSSSATATIGGPFIPGARITFTNTPIPNTGALGDFVWHDLNANGVQDSGEPGIAGVTVSLNTGATTTTDANGAYSFTQLAPGTYTVTVGTPAGYAASPTGAGTTETDNNGSGASVTLNNTIDNSIDFGFYKLGSIGDFVWNDLNANGVQDSGEPGIAGATVTLSNGSSTISTTTDATGAYAFNNLAPGSYTVTVATPTGFLASPSNAGGDPANDSNGSGTTVTVAGNANTTIDFGFYQPGSIGDFVWNDLNANGVQDSGELGIAGATVTLTNGSSTITTTTDANGAYTFNNLLPGTYTVTVGTPSGFVASPSNAGGDPAKDSNGSGTTVTVAANSNTTIDFGFWNPGSIGNYVWNDLDGDGVQDSGEPGIAGVLVSLSNGATATTDANGAYLFSNLPSGTYTVTVAAPAGFLPSPTGAGTPATDNNGSPATTTITGNNDLTIDFGFYKPGVLGDLVWHDYDQDGIQDSGEPGIAGVTVSLSNGATTTTDANGNYSFTNLPPGNYTVSVAAPSGFTASPTGAGTPGTDSNGSPTSAAVAGNTNNTLDFGFYRRLVATCFSVTVVQGAALTPVTVTATGGVGPYTFTATGLPAGITLSSGGTLSGTTLFTGTFSISVKVTDSKGNTATNGTCSLRVTPKATGYTTFTMGGWGAAPSGGNAGELLRANWTLVFGTSGVTVGGGKTLKFTSQPAVQAFLPAGETPGRLTASATNPTTTVSGVFGGQILALKLAVEFSNKGVLKPGLSALKIATGTWAGMTVAQVLANANAVLGGGALPTGMSISDINDIVDAINNNFTDGETNNGYLIP